jgi:hypothetical protein
MVSEIITAWNDLSGCLSISILSPLQACRVVQLCEEYPKIEWWKSLFSEVKKTMPRLQGENDGGWVADLGWLVDAKNWANVINRRYVDRGGAGSGKNSKKGGTTHADRVGSAKFDDLTGQHMPAL